MYSHSYGQPTALSNNPFVDDPTTAHARFPDISNQPQQYPPQYHPQAYAPAGPYQPQPQPMSPQTQFTPPSYVHQYPAQAPQPTSIGAFQPTTTGFPQQYPIASGYPYVSHPTQPPPSSTAPPSYLAEFDPYTQASPASSPSQQSQITPRSTGTAPPGVPHPRDLIRVHKAGLEAWDTYSWKQLLSACDALKEAWHARKQQADGVVRQYGGHVEAGLFGPDPAFGYQSQVEGWKQVLKDANDNFDTVVACTFQLHEVFNSYRQSGDQASKRRVRESCNAAVKALPDWPSN